jgi:hypothetical protein
MGDRNPAKKAAVASEMMILFMIAPFFHIGEPINNPIIRLLFSAGI